MKSLKTLQSLAKGGKVLCTIVFVLSIVGVFAVAFSLIGVIVFKDTIVEGGKTFSDMLIGELNMNMPSVYVTLICALIACIVEIIASKMAEKYFKYQINAGTPFTHEGASKMLKLGVWLIILPLIYALTCSIVNIIFVLTNDNIVFEGYGYTSTVGLGIAFIICSCIFKYGADVATEKIEKIEEKDVAEKN